ncbi:hypothetical protein NH340_JMT04931 [Sarcoptes scabiei]|nr:hypothetical protein NH340_JMT04931 [Sarcoptes scabiei]
MEIEDQRQEEDQEKSIESFGPKESDSPAIIVADVDSEIRFTNEKEEHDKNRKHRDQIENKNNTDNGNNSEDGSDQSKPPNLDKNELIILIEKLYNLQGIASIKELNSYDDRNYYLRNYSNEEFVLKITNRDDTAREGLIESQNEMILFLHRNNFNVPYPLPNSIDGSLTIRRSLPFSTSSSTSTMSTKQLEQKKFAIRLFRYVSGTILAKVPMSRELLIDCGQYIARLSLTLQQFHNALLKKREFLWSLASIPELDGYIKFVSDSKRQELVRKCFEDFNQIFSRPKPCCLNADSNRIYCYLHGDLNEQNIIVQQDVNDGGKRNRIYGLIDFGDIFFGPRMFDLAIFLAYVMLLDSDDYQLDPIEQMPRFVIEGYSKLIQLNRNDLRQILICSRARLAQSLTLGAYTFTKQPDNQYLLTSARKGWSILERLNEYDSKYLINLWINTTDETNKFENEKEVEK